MNKRLFYKFEDGNVINVSNIINVCFICFIKESKIYRINLKDKFFYDIDEKEYKELLKFMREEGLLRYE